MANKFDLDQATVRPETERLNINAVADWQHYVIFDLTETQFNVASRPDPEEQASKRKLAEADAAYQRRRDQALLYMALGVVGGTLAICAYLVLLKGATTEDGKWAATLLVQIVTALVAYMTGRSSR